MRGKRINKEEEKALPIFVKELEVKNDITKIFLTLHDGELFGNVLSAILEAMKSSWKTMY